MRAAPDEVHIRRVGFRTGTDAELVALHAVEAPIAAECGAHRMPQQVDAYVAFARNLPSQFDDHAWLAETGDEMPIAAGFCWSNAAGDARAMECEVLVQRDRRREGIGARLFAEICDEAAADRAITAHVVDLRRSAGRRGVLQPARRASGESQPHERAAPGRRRLAPGPRLVARRRAREHGYHLEMIDGAFPEHLRADAATFHHIMQTAPRDELDVGAVHLAPDDVAELDRALLEAGRTRWTALVRDARGACVGGTEVTFEQSEPEVVLQQNTGIDPAHRGLGLAKWAKAAILERIRGERPEAQRIRTGNAFSNAPMLAINDALGFTVMARRTEWQVNVDDARPALDR